MKNPNCADSPKDRPRRADRQQIRNCGASSDGGQRPCSSCKSVLPSSAPPRPSCGPGEGQRAFASVVTVQQDKKLKARVGSGEVHKEWRCLPNNCLGAASPAAYQGAHHNGFFCGRGGCPRFVRSTGDRCDGREDEGSTAACNKAFPFAHAQNAFSGLAAVFKVVTRPRLHRGILPLLGLVPSPIHPPTLHIGLLGTTAAADRFRLLGYPASPRAERLASMPSDSDLAKANLSSDAKTLVTAVLSPQRIPIPFSKLP